LNLAAVARSSPRSTKRDVGYRGAGYELSQRVRKRIERIWGWMKTAAEFCKTRHRGLRRNRLAAYLIGSAYKNPCGAPGPSARDGHRNARRLATASRGVGAGYTDL
jgi:hypothetical protein